MCNICVNSLCFVSRDLTKLKELHANIKAAADNKANNTVVKLLEAYGYKQGEIALLTDIRDHFSDIENITQKGPVFYFMAETCSAWDENLLGFYTLLREKYNNTIYMYHQSEEEGLSLYSVYDPTGLFFHDRYKVDMCLKGEYTTEYFSSYSEVVSMLESYFPALNISVFDSPTDLEERIADSLDEDSDDFFNLHIFQTYSKYTWDNTNHYKEAA